MEESQPVHMPAGGLGRRLLSGPSWVKLVTATGHREEEVKERD